MKLATNLKKDLNLKIKMETKKEEQLMKITKQKWLDLFHKNEGIDKQACREGIEWVYSRYLKLDKPEIVFVDSQQAAQKFIETRSLENSLRGPLRDHIKYIQRQGERFSTVFDEKGTQTLKTISKKAVEDVVTISGDEYFNKLTYEY